MKKIVLACILIFTLWPPAGGMATSGGKDIIDRKYTFKETINYINMRLDIIADQEKLTAYQRKKLKQEVHFHTFINKYVYCLDDGKRRFDLDFIDTLILEELVDMYDNEQTVFNLELDR